VLPASSILSLQHFSPSSTLFEILRSFFEMAMTQSGGAGRGGRGGGRGDFRKNLPKDKPDLVS
jgi:hypothetical protein